VKGEQHRGVERIRRMRHEAERPGCFFTPRAMQSVRTKTGSGTVERRLASDTGSRTRAAAGGDGGAMAGRNGGPVGVFGRLRGGACERYRTACPRCSGAGGLAVRGSGCVFCDRGCSNSCSTAARCASCSQVSITVAIIAFARRRVVPRALGHREADTCLPFSPCLLEEGYEAVAGERRRSQDLNGQQRWAHGRFPRARRSFRITVVWHVTACQAAQSVARPGTNKTPLSSIPRRALFRGDHRRARRDGEVKWRAAWRSRERHHRHSDGGESTFCRRPHGFLMTS
jgi:hypothetical protein